MLRVMMHDPCTAAAIIAGICAEKDSDQFPTLGDWSYVVREEGCMLRTARFHRQPCKACSSVERKARRAESCENTFNFSPKRLLFFFFLVQAVTA